GARDLYPAVAMVAVARNRYVAVGQPDARSTRPAPARPGTDRIVLLFRLGVLHPSEPLSGGAPPAARVFSGAAAHGGGDAHSSGGCPAVAAQARAGHGAWRAVYPRQ